MNPLDQSSKEMFFGELNKLVKQVSEKNEGLLDRIEATLLSNPQFIANPNDRDAVKKILHPLKIQITLSRNSPQDRMLAFKILNLVKQSKTIQPDEVPHWKDSDFSRWEISQFRKTLEKDIEFSSHYKLVSIEDNPHSYLGRGREGIVYLAEEKLTGKLMAIKVRCEREPDVHPYDGQEEVAAVGLFCLATGYPFEAKNYQIFNAKSYIKGRNLEDILKSNDLFNGSQESKKIMGELKELFTKLIQARLFFADIAPENFVYDGNNFYMIDLRPVKICSSQDEARIEYKNELLDKADEGIAWTQSRWYHADCKPEDKSYFLKIITDILLDVR